MTKYSNDKGHFIAYVRWDVILEWKALEARVGRKKRETRLVPYAYGTAQKRIMNLAKKGDVFWIITLPKFDRYPFSPSLVARLEIEKIIDQGNEGHMRKEIPDFIRRMYNPNNGKKNWRYVVMANKSKSRYYAVNYAYDIIRELKFVGMIETLKGLDDKMYGTVAQHFQTIRQLQVQSGGELEEFAARVEKQRSVFISYRRGKGSSKVRKIADRLLKKNTNCWIDVSMMPGKIAKGKIRISDEKLESAIKHAIRQSNMFLAFQRSDYFKGRWTKFEWEEANSKLKGNERFAKKPFAIENIDLKSLGSGDPIDKIVNKILRKLPKVT